MIEPTHSALEGEVLTTGPLGKSLSLGFELYFLKWLEVLTYEAEHFPICLFAIHISSLLKLSDCLDLWHIFIWVVGLLIVEF